MDSRVVETKLLLKKDFFRRGFGLKEEEAVEQNESRYLAAAAAAEGEVVL